MHVAYSKLMKGVGVVAGGPYYCAENVVLAATTTCMTAPAFINLVGIESYMELVSGVYIDNVSNLEGSKVYIYAGKDDTVVNPDVGRAAEALYINYGTDLKTEYGIASEHCMPTKNYGNKCDYKGSPYINNCGYDAAFELLNHIYGG